MVGAVCVRVLMMGNPYILGRRSGFVPIGLFQMIAASLLSSSSVELFSLGASSSVLSVSVA